MTGGLTERSAKDAVQRNGNGIGIKNVRERMQVLYGDAAEVFIESRPGRGTKVALTMPVIGGEGNGWGRLRDATDDGGKGVRR